MGAKADYLLNHQSKTIAKERLHLPGPTFVSDVWQGSDRNPQGPSGKDDFAEAAITAVIDKRAGGTGLISGRKAFLRPLADGVKLLNIIQDVYLCDQCAVA